MGFELLRWGEKSGFFVPPTFHNNFLDNFTWGSDYASWQPNEASGAVGINFNHFCISDPQCSTTAWESEPYVIQSRLNLLEERICLREKQRQSESENLWFLRSAKRNFSQSNTKTFQFLSTEIHTAQQCTRSEQSLFFMNGSSIKSDGTCSTSCHSSTCYNRWKADWELLLQTSIDR